MNLRKRLHGVVFLLAAAEAVLSLGIARADGPLAELHKPEPMAMKPAVAAEFAKIRSAETIADPEQRCLAYPDPAEFSWDPNVVKAFCHLHSRRMISWSEFTTAVDRHDIRWLQKTFDGYLERSLGGGEHGFFIWTYWNMFQNASAENLEATTKWVAADPDSAYALAARGTYYVEAAYAARGTQFRKDTPAVNFERMNALVAKGKSDLQEALRRAPRLIAAYHGLLRIAQLKGDEDLLQSSIRSALALDVADQWIYDDWMDAVEPKWGGSLDALGKAADAAAANAARNPLLARSPARPFCYAAEQWACKVCGHAADDTKALALYRQAATFGPASCFLKNAPRSANRVGDAQTEARYYSQAIRFLGEEDSIAWRAGAYGRVGRADWALADVDKLLEKSPRNARALDRKAYLVELQDRPDEAAALYRKELDVEPTNERAALQLSRLYLSTAPDAEKARPLVAGLIERNPKLARAWLYKAALAKNDPVACREALENYLKYVDRDDAYEAKDIAGAQARLEALK